MRITKTRRILLIILIIIAVHVILIYGFLKVQVKPNNNPKVVYTSIVTDSKLLPTYIAKSQMPCVELKRQSDSDTAPLPNCIEPREPPANYQILGENSYIELQFTVDGSGKVQTPSITKTSSDQALDQAALEQVRDTWVFSPCVEAEPQACKQTIKFKWQPN